MSLTDKINDDIKKAMLAREKDKLEALRAVKSALLLLKTSESGSDITEDDEIKLLQKLVKQRRETAEIYAGQNRPDLAEAEKFQAEVISVYLPSQLSPEELKPVIQDIIQSTGATGIKDMGKVMAAASQQLAGKADNKTISMIVKELLGL
ncbi:MAG: GatB/YqeY domain-containing protein [Lentimicrobiaceae bacterium]|nr:GatB/YqeY domain-containing protein [Lentimicrobiaceae bacterium]MCB9023929.1 GatB/YqeY domain-containing protein [Lentimicrobiaceae bacterium]